jgi:hypothetical protein
MFIKACLIQHSTRTMDLIGQFGICVYMQASFFFHIVDSSGRFEDDKEWCKVK